MPEPKFDDLLEYEFEASNEEACNLVCRADAALASAAYWQGRCEVLEAENARMAQGHREAMEQLRRTHEDGVKRVDAANQLILGYLKDRLNRLETKGENRADA